MATKALAVFIILCVGFGLPPTARAGLVPEAGAMILVNTVTDELNSDGDCSLREAIRAANLNQAVDACAAGNGADTIVLQSGVTYTLTRVGADDTAINGDLDIADDLTITGSNAIVDGNGATTLDRVIQVLSGKIVFISNLTLRNGRGTSFGAGIRNAGTLTLRSVTLSNNQSTGNAGGGIANEAGVLSVINSTISNNTASTLGGGIALLGGTLTTVNLSLNNNAAISDRGGGLWIGTNASATLIYSTINNNSADANGGGIYNENSLTLLGSTLHTNDAGTPGGVTEYGGGIYNEDTLVMSHSTVRNNTADDSGGISNDGGVMTIRNSTINNNGSTSAAGIRNTNAGTATLVNSTVSSNSATAGAGGIANGSGATLQLSNVTIAFNSADSDGNNFGDGGGLSNSATAIVRNTLIGENIDGSASGTIFPDCSGGFTSDGYNLIENTTGCAIGGNTSGNITGIDPTLTALALNGGRTQTNAFPTGAPPHDAANPGGCVDQLGAAVVADQRDGARRTRCDIGAFEFAACLVIGDVDDDGDVDALDIQQTALGWPDPAENPAIDLVVDGFVDMKDIIATTARFGLACS